jgi:hypothetical protein
MIEKETKRYVIELNSEMLGTVPKDPEIYKAYIESKKPNGTNGATGVDITEEDEAANVIKAEEKGWTGMMKDENGLYLYSYLIRGFLKSAGEALAPQLSTMKAKKGAKVAEDGTEPPKTKEPLKAIRSKIDKFVFVTPRRIYLGVMEPAGVVERPLRCMTMQGPRVTLARSDYVNAGTQLTFYITLFKNKEITWEMIDQLFEYGEFQGLGQFRSGSYGQFKVISVTPVN